MFNNVILAEKKKILEVWQKLPFFKLNINSVIIPFLMLKDNITSLEIVIINSDLPPSYFLMAAQDLNFNIPYLYVNRPGFGFYDFMIIRTTLFYDIINGVFFQSKINADLSDPESGSPFFIKNSEIILIKYMNKITYFHVDFKLLHKWNGYLLNSISGMHVNISPNLKFKYSLTLDTQGEISHYSSLVWNKYISILNIRKETFHYNRQFFL